MKSGVKIRFGSTIGGVSKVGVSCRCRGNFRLGPLLLNLGLDIELG